MENMMQNLKKYFKENIIAVFFTFIMFLILANTLLINPIIGYANNGDFGRLKDVAGIMDIDIVNTRFHIHIF